MLSGIPQPQIAVHSFASGRGPRLTLPKGRGPLKISIFDHVAWLSVGSLWRMVVGGGWQLLGIGAGTGVPPLHAIRGPTGPILGDFGPF